MQSISGKALVTWWLTLGAVGALVFVVLLYSTPGVARRASAVPSRSETRAIASGARAPRPLP